MRIIGIVALVFGLMTIVAGGRALFGDEAARAAAGAAVPFVLWFNFLAGFAYVVAGAGLIMRAPWGAWLSALVAERCDPVQSGLTGPGSGEELTHLIDRLGARFGLLRVSRLLPQDTHIPEYAVAAVPAHAARQAVAVAPPFAEQDALGAARPIRLFERPQPIEVTAEVPDGAPLQFNWRHVRHHVVKAEGPERIAMEWWRDDRGNKLTRDYFRVESRSGTRMWLYREGLYDREEVSRPHWYLHGLFA